MPTHTHLEAIRSALNKKHAAVMVGSGFSRNAINGSTMPTWDGLVDTFSSAIYSNDELEKIQRNKIGVSDTLRLALEYEAVRGRDALEAELKNLIPNSKVHPGHLHKSLLSLPWTDVFTTNYDTLLERAAEHISQYSYVTILSPEDIPRSKSGESRRIVKLHGSFPSNRPFIVTEEDYRTYPQKRAPFVNLVQQSMMENVFCFIGFSGNDPNFLAWHGWIRDNLKDYSPKIYFISHTAPNAGQESLSAKRNIIYINLVDTFGQLPIEDLYSNLFNYLYEKYDNSISQWPYNNYYKMKVDIGNCGIEESASKYITFAKHDRESYPGWLIPPYQNANRLEDSTYNEKFLVYEIFNKTENKITKALCIYEFAWRIDKSQTTFPIELVNELQESISTFESIIQNKKNLTLFDIINEKDEHKSYFFETKKEYSLYEKIGEILFFLQLTLLKLYREHRHTDYGKLKAELLNKKTSNDNRSEVHYQHCLWLLEQADHTALANYVETWTEEETDPYWTIRKAMIIGESGQLTRAKEMALSGLNKIRHQIQREGSVYELSREAWAIYLLDHLDFAIKHTKPISTLAEQEQEREQDKNTAPKWVDRLQSLKAYSCDPSGDMEFFKTTLQAPPRPPQEDTTKNHQFDPFSYTTTQHLASTPPKDESSIQAQRYIRLLETVACPPLLRCGFININISSNSLRAAAERLALAGLEERSISTLMRIGGVSTIEKSNILTRSSIARIEQSYIDNLLETLIKNTYEELNTTIKTERHSNLLNFLFESISRLTAKASDEKLSELLKLFTSSYNSKKIESNFLIWDSYANFVKRLFKNCKISIIEKYIFSILQTSINIQKSNNPYNLPSFFQYIKKLNIKIDSKIAAELLEKTPTIDSTMHQNSILDIVSKFVWLYEHTEHNEYIEKIITNKLWKNNKSTILDQSSIYWNTIYRLPTPRNIDLDDIIRDKIKNSKENIETIYQITSIFENIKLNSEDITLIISLINKVWNETTIKHCSRLGTAKDFLSSKRESDCTYELTAIINIIDKISKKNEILDKKNTRLIAKTLDSIITNTTKLGQMNLKFTILKSVLLKSSRFNHNEFISRFFYNGNDEEILELARSIFKNYEITTKTKYLSEIKNLLFISTKTGEPIRTKKTILAIYENIANNITLFSQTDLKTLVQILERELNNLNYSTNDYTRYNEHEIPDYRICVMHIISTIINHRPEVLTLQEITDWSLRIESDPLLEIRNISDQFH